ncbi:hypothetical protein [Acetobacter indonesiensis]|nr:hypothetical protein [Acetobacter indonesiensis]
MGPRTSGPVLGAGVVHPIGQGPVENIKQAGAAALRQAARPGPV